MPYLKLLFFIAMGGLLVVCLIDCILMPRAFMINSGKYINDGLFSKSRQYAAKKFLKSKYAVDKLLYGSHYTYSDAFCDDADSRYDKIISQLSSAKIPSNYSKKMIAAYLTLILTTSNIFTIKNMPEKATSLYTLVKEKAYHGANMNRYLATMAITEMLLSCEGAEQFNQIEAFLQKYGEDINVMDFSKCLMLFRQYQISGKDEYLKNSMVLAPTKYVREMLNSLAAAVVKEEGTE